MSEPKKDAQEVAEGAQEESQERTVSAEHTENVEAADDLRAYHSDKELAAIAAFGGDGMTDAEAAVVGIGRDGKNIRPRPDITPGTQMAKSQAENVQKPQESAEDKQEERNTDEIDHNVFKPEFPVSNLVFRVTSVTGMSFNEAVQLLQLKHGDADETAGQFEKNNKDIDPFKIVRALQGAGLSSEQILLITDPDLYLEKEVNRDLTMPEHYRKTIDLLQRMLDTQFAMSEKQTTKIKELQETNDALDAQAVSLQAENEGQKAKIEEQAQQITQLTDEQAVLAEQIRKQEEQIQRLLYQLSLSQGDRPDTHMTPSHSAPSHPLPRHAPSHSGTTSAPHKPDTT